MLLQISVNFRKNQLDHYNWEARKKPLKGLGGARITP
jgi:hypothetical protein